MTRIFLSFGDPPTIFLCLIFHDFSVLFWLPFPTRLFFCFFFFLFFFFFFSFSHSSLYLRLDCLFLTASYFLHVFSMAREKRNVSG
ncbi:hypothetical protein BJX61DRAFT_530537 [Aspergillus egyptiacus]|nr:hypothetical protein BJX61DRAFT_530537 [Aspergillus egyptiacus]